MKLADFDVAGALLEAGAVRLSPDAPFTWASGLKSPIYCDNRQLLGFPAVRSEIAEALTDSILTGDMRPSLIAGTSTAGIPWAALAADRLGLPLAYVRPQPKDHGMGRRVEGPSAEEHRVTLIEDLISTGGSSIKCAEALREDGAEAVEILALFSYGLPKAEAAFARAGIRWRSLATFSDLVSKAVAIGAITMEAQESLAMWRRDPEGWGRGEYENLHSYRG